MTVFEYIEIEKKDKLFLNFRKERIYFFVYIFTQFFMKKTIIIPGVLLLSLTSCALPSKMETFYGSGDEIKS
jgi:hypothetical protein